MKEGEMIKGFCANGDDPKERENIVVGERGELLECCDALALMRRGWIQSSRKVESWPLIEPVTVLAGKLSVS